MEKGGKYNEVFAHHNAEAYLNAYAEAARIWEEKKSVSVGPSPVLQPSRTAGYPDRRSFRAIGVSTATWDISQIRRYESGQSQPTLDAIRKLAIALSVSADTLLFASEERGPDDDLKFQFEAASRLDPEEKNVIRSVIESIVLRNTVKAAERRFAAPDTRGGSL